MTLRNDSDGNLLEDLGLSRPSDSITLTASQLLRIIRDEREACAKLCEERDTSCWAQPYVGVENEFAEAIRERSNNE